MHERGRAERYAKHELSAPPPDRAKTGRANRKGEPVLYIASSRSTAIAEIRAWKGAVVAFAEIAIKRRLSLIDLSTLIQIKSPFFVELLKWKLELRALLRRLGSDLSRPITPYEAGETEVIYRPTQLLALLIRASGYDGFIYPSAMGPGTNVALFNPDDADVKKVSYTRVKRVAYFAEALSDFDDVHEEGPYDFALTKK